MSGTSPLERLGGRGSCNGNGNGNSSGNDNDNDKSARRVAVVLHNEPLSKTKGGDNCWTLMIIAAMRGHVTAVKHVAESGADLNEANATGWTPLTSAAKRGHVAVVQYLVRKGADKEKRNGQGLTALQLAQENHHAEVTERAERP